MMLAYNSSGNMSQTASTLRQTEKKQTSPNPCLSHHTSVRRQEISTHLLSLEGEKQGLRRFTPLTLAHLSQRREKRKKAHRGCVCVSTHSRGPGSSQTIYYSKAASHETVLVLPIHVRGDCLIYPVVRVQVCLLSKRVCHLFFLS